MNEAKQERLEAKGWKVGTVSEFLDLTPEETDLVEIKLVLGGKCEGPWTQDSSDPFPG
jgi:hypothetical protein